jgi:DNA polymerase V
MFALIDCNNFFVSCERLFRPDLENVPVIVLSSNDGCAISRSGEAKELGIPMGAPAFKLASQFNLVGGPVYNRTQPSVMQGSGEQWTEPYMQYGEGAAQPITPQRAGSTSSAAGSAGRQAGAVRTVVSLSANFELYGDVSQRLTTLLTHVTPRIEVYSVDESFLDLSELGINDYTAWAAWLRERILREIGVPVSVGIAPTKTLAKLANHRAKKDEMLEGVLAITDPADTKYDHYYSETPIGDLWGVGWRLAPKLKAEGIHSADDLRHMYKPHARQLMGVHGARMIAELNGVPCIPFDQEESAPKTIMRGRTLGQEIRDQETLEAAISTLAARAAFCLRRSHQLVRTAGISLNTNKHKPGYRRLDQTLRFAMPTADTGTICRALADALHDIYQPALGIYRVNVLFYELVPTAALPLDLFGSIRPEEHDRATARMAAFDAINRRYGRHAIRSAAEDLSQAWQPRKGACSPRYTTKWSDLPVATF